MKGCMRGCVRPRQGVSKAMVRQELRLTGRASPLPKAKNDNNRRVDPSSPLGNVVVAHRHLQAVGHARNWQVASPTSSPVLEVSGRDDERSAAYGQDKATVFIAPQC
jgi:hypothetical protein